MKKIFFEQIYNAIWDIDLKRVIHENDPRLVGLDGTIIEKIGLDGFDVTIEYGTYQYYISITVWSPKNTRGEVNKIDNIVLEVFRKAGIDEWYE